MKPGDTFTMAGTYMENPERRELDSPACRVCGCTQNHACNPPCAWFDPTLCTTCALAAEALREWSQATVKPSLSALLREADIERRAFDLKKLE